MLDLPIPNLDGKLRPPKKYDTLEEAFDGVRDDLGALMEESNG